METSSADVPLPGQATTKDGLPDVETENAPSVLPLDSSMCKKGTCLTTGENCWKRERMKAKTNSTHGLEQCGGLIVS